MILEDILSTTKNNVSIMKDLYSVMIINCKFDIWRNFQRSFLEQEVVDIDTYNDRIRVWLKGV